MDIKPIPTKAFGITFRSRLEARWATYFTEMGFKFCYEYEGFDLGAFGFYLPDFWLPQVKMWAEVKPVEFTSIETVKCSALQKNSGCACLMLDGQPDFRSYFESPHLNDDNSGWSDRPIIDYIVDDLYLDDGRLFSCAGGSFPEPERFKRFSPDGLRVYKAVDAALNARFWEVR